MIWLSVLALQGDKRARLTLILGLCLLAIIFVLGYRFQSTPILWASSAPRRGRPLHLAVVELSLADLAARQ